MNVGEPSYPLAAAERGQLILVQADTTFEVGDHDFSNFSIIPSVSLLVGIPSQLSGSWYHGLVTVFLKEGAFEPSSPFRHMAELLNTLSSNLMISLISQCSACTQMGDQIRVTYNSGKMSLTALYVKLDLDYLLAARTAPCHSSRNPVECMSALNLGLQCVGLIRREGSETFEREASKCNAMKDLRKAADRCPDFKSEALDSIEPAKILLTQVFEHLQLKQKNIKCSLPASDEDIVDMWNNLLLI